MGHRVHRPLNQRGATYLVLLVVIAVISAVAAASLSAGSAFAQRDKEIELLFIGTQFRAALLSYEQHTPPGGRRQPISLEQLLRDDRTAVPRRHLRRIFVDPMLGHEAWGTAKDAAGGIVGVHSLATGRPVKQEKFDPPFENFRDSRSYSDWVFSPYAIVRSN